ncbi:uncharacterized protein LOC126736991 [Anthonomus grandis grandis]|uniref:uncharacterized protein LOC126736991 n=1 Tax=Anthonomus grandis grandis TaxID=2921223 RepID=UPI002165B24B|nr:uncharacterized protein LOC126736991 [Anthonomus grandis grandis]
MCNCNDSQFSKLRENWSRYLKCPTTPCQCCQFPKNKMKGKFGVAYVIETPNRKCKPCGWEIEFTDTPSTIENNCKKIMNWITCPPLGECNNANTTVCCCSPPEQSVLCTLNKSCCKSNNKTGCSKTARCDCCCEQFKPKGCCCTNKNPKCCCSKGTSKPCCSKPRNESPCCNPRCCKKPKTKCCRCCPLPPSEQICPSCCPAPNDGCCCNPQPQYYQNESDSDDCCCNQNDYNKKPDCGCNCNCSACKCNGKKTSSKRKDRDHDSKHNSRPKEQSSKHSKSTEESSNKPSKNFNSLESNRVKLKANPRSPYTISMDYLPKKGPDKDDEEVIVLKTPPLSEKEHEDIDKPQEFTEGLVKNDAIEDDNSDITEEKLTESTLVPKESGRESGDATFEEKQKSNGNTATNEAENPKLTPPLKPVRKLRGAALLRKIKEEHRKEMDAIHAASLINHESVPVTGEESRVSDDRTESTIRTIEPSEDIPGVKRRLKKGLGKKLLERIHQKHREELEAIHHEEPHDKPTENLKEYFLNKEDDIKPVQSEMINP